MTADGKVKVLALDAGAFNRLCGPLFEILKRNMTVYESYGAAGAAKVRDHQFAVDPLLLFPGAHRSVCSLS